jgi:CheY-like chemotaxis protein
VQGPAKYRMPTERGMTVFPDSECVSHPEEKSMKRILLIEDEPDVRLLVEATLTFRGFPVLSCESGTRGLEEARRGDFQLVLLDIMMPDMSGYDVLEALRADKRTAHLPVVLLSASSPESEAEHMARLGVIKFIPKPFDSKSLGLEVAHLLEEIADESPG